jgi:diaminopropionate ammonia-lyase
VIDNPACDPAAVPPVNRAAAAFHRGLHGYAPTPLHDLGGVFVKDESNRLGLPAFKVLGASWAVERALAPDVHTLVAASAGNHGCAVAAVARMRGLKARVYVPERSVPARREAIASEGAEVLIHSTYEEAVARAAADGEAEGFLEVADVGASGPAHDVIDGYATLFDELPDGFDTLLVPAGVGSLAAAAARYGAEKGIAVTAVEPDTAACVSASLAAGEPTAVVNPGSSMAGLDCAEVSIAAWPSLKSGLRGAVTVSDEQAHQAMRELAARGLSIGDSGAAPYAALEELGDLGRVVLIATEGVTDPEGYARVVTPGA